MKEMFLLGAGASIDAGIPGAYDMTQKMIEIIEGQEYYHQYSVVLNFVASGLIFKYGSEGRNPYKGLNIEELFTAIQLISERKSLEIAPFVNAWSPYINAIESRFAEPSLFDYERLLDDIYHFFREQGVFSNNPSRSTLNFQKGFSPMNSWNFRNHFSDIVMSIASGKNTVVFKKTLEIMISVLKNLVWMKDYSKLDYLFPLVSYCQRKNVCIASLNYDNAIEVVGKEKHLQIDTGIVEWSKRNEFIFLLGAIPLIKIHGSINWNLQNFDNDQNIPMPKQVITIEEINPNPNDKNNFSPAVIFGGKNKLTAKGPFLDLLRVFREKLFESDKLIIIGYSFRDDHVNEYISQWINNNSEHKLVIVDPGFESYQGDYYNRLRSLINNGRANVINQEARIAIPGLITELEGKDHTK